MEDILKNKSLTVVMIISFVIFLIMTLLTFSSKSLIYDELVIQWINQYTTPLLRKMMESISILGSSEVILLVTVGITLYFMFKKDWLHCIFFLLVSVGGVVLNLALKMIIHRERPGEMSHIDVFNMSLEIPSYSFPSGHTMRISILLLFVLYLIFSFVANKVIKRSLSALFILLAAAVSVSRIILESHFPSDVIAAVSISIVWFSLCVMFMNKYVPVTSDY